ncbi:hypothetical protein MA20_31805 [Bradyrhizobium japonicum]|uniref:Uncharacterized protein n=1 Tax=Bradyrhizobium japonicum TaxID=375 RepID=A0A0A3XR73_BRAJP|nr:hypothetical protein MA20_31805 [Bradyrhizobium japonicum]
MLMSRQLIFMLPAGDARYPLSATGEYVDADRMTVDALDITVVPSHSLQYMTAFVVSSTVTVPEANQVPLVP